MRLKHARISRFTSNIFKIFASGGVKGASASPWTPSDCSCTSRRNSFARRYEFFLYFWIPVLFDTVEKISYFETLEIWQP
jgi:hypothetical protein